MRQFLVLKSYVFLNHPFSWGGSVQSIQGRGSPTYQLRFGFKLAEIQTNLKVCKTETGQILVLVLTQWLHCLKGSGTSCVWQPGQNRAHFRHSHPEPPRSRNRTSDPDHWPKPPTRDVEQNMRTHLSAGSWTQRKPTETPQQLKIQLNSFLNVRESSTTAHAHDLKQVKLRNNNKNKTKEKKVE